MENPTGESVRTTRSAYPVTPVRNVSLLTISLIVSDLSLELECEIPLFIQRAIACSPATLRTTLVELIRAFIKSVSVKERGLAFDVLAASLKQFTQASGPAKGFVARSFVLAHKTLQRLLRRAIVSPLFQVSALPRASSDAADEVETKEEFAGQLKKKKVVRKVQYPLECERGLSKSTRFSDDFESFVRPRKGSKNQSRKEMKLLRARAVVKIARTRVTASQPQVFDKPQRVRTPKAQKAFTRSQVRVTAGEAVARAVAQVPSCLSAVERRKLRDLERAAAARKKVKQDYKKAPKAEREASVKRNRDKRSGVETQAGVNLSDAAKGALAVMTGLALRKLTQLLGKSEKTVDSLNGLIGHLKEFSESLKRFFGATLWVVPLLVVVYYAIKHFRVGNAVVLTLVSGALGATVGPKCWEYVSEFFREGDDTPQTAESETEESTEGIEVQSGSLPGVSRLMATALCFSVLGTSSKTKVSEFVKRIGMLGRISDGWETFLTWMLNAFEACINFGRARFGKERVTLFKGAKAPTYAWARAIDELHAIQSTKSKVDSETTRKMVMLIREGCAFKEVYRGTPMARFIDEYYAKAVNMLQPFQGSLSASNNNRFEPICAIFLGKPGIGKTVMSAYLCATLLIESGLLPPGSTPEAVSAEIWQKGISEFWNSYTCQMAVIMDDAFQGRVDATDKDNEFMNLLRMVSSWAFPLNFADLSSKGKIFFDSRILFGTTNVESFKSEAGLVLHEPEAVARRIKFPYRIELEAAFANDRGHLDMGKFSVEMEKCMESGRGIDRFPWHIWTAKRHDFLSGSDTPGVVPLKHVVQDMIEELTLRKAAHERSQERMANYLSGLQCQAGREVSPFSGLKERSHVSLKEFKVLFDRHVSEDRAFGHLFEKALKGTVFVVGLGLGLLVVKALLTGIWRFLKGMFGSRKGPNPQSNRPLAGKVKQVRRDDVRLQTGIPGVYQKVYKNTYKMFVDTTELEVIIGQVCFVDSTLALQPEHFTAKIRDLLERGKVSKTSKITLRHVENEQLSVQVSVERYLGYKRVTKPEVDFEFLDFVDIRAHTRITNLFITDDDIEHLKGKEARLDICYVDDGARILPSNKQKVLTIPSLRFGKNLRFGGRRLDRYFEYGVSTAAGDCGAPLTMLDNSLFCGRTVLGFHVAGDPIRRMGYSNIVTQGDIAAARKILNTITDAFDEGLCVEGIEVECGSDYPTEDRGSFLPIGKVNKPLLLNTRTALFKTRLYGSLGPCGTAPAPLAPVYRSGVLCRPMSNALRPFCTPIKVFEKPWFPLAMHTTLKPFFSITKDWSRRIYTVEEAIVGEPRDKFRSIPRKTSAGYPLCTNSKGGKKEFLGFDENQPYNLDMPRLEEIRAECALINEWAKQGKRRAHLFGDFLKDEIRSDKKVDAVATRIISASSFPYTVEFRRYFGAFGVAMMSNNIETGMAPGMCAYTDWGRLGVHLTKKGPDCFAGDFKGFDASQQGVILMFILDAINRWYDDGPENAMIRRVLWEDLVHSRHVGGPGDMQNVIYQWNKSLPSGHPFTTIVNSIYSLFLLVCVYMHKTGDLTGFWEHVSPITFGDDNACNVDPETGKLFNQVTVAAGMKELFDMTYTSDKKDAELVPLVPITGITFLKRGFLLEDNEWLCPLELSSFLYSCYWCKNSKLVDKICVDNLEIAMHELSWHSQEVWNTYAPQVYALLGEMNAKPLAPCDRSQYNILVRNLKDYWF